MKCSPAALLLLSRFSRVRLCATPETAAHQVPPSLGFSRQEHWSGLPFPSPMHEVKSESEVAQSFPTLHDSMNCSLPGSSVHGIFQARVLEWGAITFSECSLGISNFLEEISSLFHSNVFLYFLAQITEEGFLISPCCSLELCIQMGISVLFSFAFCFCSFHSYLEGLLRQPFCFFAFLFLGDGLAPCLLYNVTNLHP